MTLIPPTVFSLWVVGESSSNPEEWSQWSEYSLVIARDEKEALYLAGYRADGPCRRVPMTGPLHLVTMQEPNLGPDL